MQRALAVIVLTKDEEANLVHCLASLAPLDADVFVVDSGSTDKTVQVAVRYGARVLSHPWTNHSVQMNWAIDHLQSDAPWVARIDADEHMTPELVEELRQRISTLPADCTGLLVKRRFVIFGRWMKHGGMYPIWVLRFWRRGMARCEDRWMDEHMVLTGGNVAKLTNDIVDQNRKDLTFWIDKHNHYANHEVLDLLGMQASAGSHRALIGPAARKRWVKESVFSRAPLFLRPFAYWFVRYFLRLGFLDGKEGLVFHFLHAFWYRFLVDAKMMERDILIRRQAEDARLSKSISITSDSRPL